MLVVLLGLLHQSKVSGFDTTADIVTESNVVLCSVDYTHIVVNTKQNSTQNICYHLLWVASYNSIVLMMIAITVSLQHGHAGMQQLIMLLLQYTSSKSP